MSMEIEGGRSSDEREREGRRRKRLAAGRLS